MLKCGESWVLTNNFVPGRDLSSAVPDFGQKSTPNRWTGPWVSSHCEYSEMTHGANHTILLFHRWCLGRVIILTS